MGELKEPVSSSLQLFHPPKCLLLVCIHVLIDRMAPLTHCVCFMVPPRCCNEDACWSMCILESLLTALKRSCLEERVYLVEHDISARAFRLSPTEVQS